MTKQKQYSIIINGVKESISEIDVLINQLDKLDKNLSDMEKKVVKVNVEEVQSSKKTKSTPSTNSGLSAIEKEQLKNEQLKSEEYQKQLQTLQALKEENKQLEKLNKDIANGVRNIDGTYTNTLEGMRRKLSDMKKELASMDMGDVDGIENFAREINELNEKIKGVEQSYGTFSRNVGNYTDSMVDALNEFDGQMFELADGIEEVKQGVDSLKGKQMFDVNLGGTVVQFENISQAIGEIDDMAHATAARMQELRNAGKENTEEYARLNAEFQEFIQQSADLERVRRQTDELRDSISSSTRGLDMGVQAFQALGNAMQMASGIAGLFGQNQEEIEKSINRTVQIMAILQSAQELYNLTVQKGSVLNKVWTVSLVGAEKVMKMLGITTKATSKSFKVLRGAIAASGIGLLAILAVDAVSALMEMVNGLSKSEKALNNFADQMDRFKKSTNDWLSSAKEINDLKVKIGLTDELESSLDMFIKFRAAYKLTLGDYKNEVKKLEGIWKDATSIDTSNIERDKDNIVNILDELKNEYNESKAIVEEFRNEAEKPIEYNIHLAKTNIYEDLKQIIDGYNEYTDKQKEYAKNVLEIQDKLKDDELAMMKDGFQRKMFELNEQEIREIRKARESGIKVNEQILSIQKKYALERQKLKLEENKRIEQINKKHFDAYVQSYGDFILTSMETRTVEQQRELEVLTRGFENAYLGLRSRLNKIYEETQVKFGEDKEYSFEFKHKTTATDDSALKEQQAQLDKLKKIMDETKKEYNDAIYYAEWYADMVGLNLERVVKAHQENSLSDDEVALLHGYTENAKKELSETEKEILKYQQQISDAQKKMVEADKNYMDALAEYNKQVSLKTIKDVANTTQQVKMVVTNYLTTIMPTDKEAEGWLDNSVIIYNLTKNLDRIPEEYEKTYNELRELTNEYYDSMKVYEENNLSKFNLNVFSGLSDSLEDVFNEYGSAFDDSMAQKLMNLLFSYADVAESNMKDTNVSLDEFVNNLSGVSDSIMDLFKDIGESSDETKEVFSNFANTVSNILETGNNKLFARTLIHREQMKQLQVEQDAASIELTKQFNQKTYEEYSKQFDNILKLYDNFANSIYTGNYALDAFGESFLKIGQNIKFGDVFKTLGDEVTSARQKVDEQIGLLSETIAKMKKAGEDTSNEEAELVNLEETRDNLESLEEEIDSFTSSTKMGIGEWARTISEMMVSAFDMAGQMLTQIADMQYQNEMNKIEKLQEEYDKETELLEEKLAEQEELYEKHNSNVESIEGELQTARGDRRLFLLDQINSEMQKREQAWAQQQKIAKQQEQLERKKEQLEDRQKAAEQKRNKANQKIQIAQGLASTALAVTNALSVQPFFLRNGTSCCCCCYGRSASCNYC